MLLLGKQTQKHTEPTKQLIRFLRRLNRTFCSLCSCSLYRHSCKPKQQYHLAMIHAITPKHWSALCGVNRAGVHCRARSAPLASEPKMWANLNKKICKHLLDYSGQCSICCSLTLCHRASHFQSHYTTMRCHAVGQTGRSKRKD